ncbi:MAG: PHB depolymerase family esterase [Solirubrobacterales bacterium]|nr:PHB depolymerase family esterase [Solirubrobacterales bacterium]MBV9050718.1 PHB depolymerase family esterase [Solirubrobacterales bacterium]
MRGLDPRALRPGNQAAGRPPGVKASGGPVRAAGLQAQVHVPRRLDTANPAPLLCILHGCMQDPATFAAATLMNDAADRHGFLVVYPGQDRDNNPQGCWNWFLPENQHRDAGEPAAIAAIVSQLIDDRFATLIDRRRVFVAGLSSGGAMAAILAVCYPDLFAAVAVHSGLAYRSATTARAAFEAMQRGPGNTDVSGQVAHAAMGTRARPIPTMVIHGSDDSTVAPVNATQLLRQSMDANRLAAPELGQLDPGHPTRSWRERSDGGRPYTRSQWLDGSGALIHELLIVDGLGHAWSGGAGGGSYADPRGPAASDAILGFFIQASLSS